MEVPRLAEMLGTRCRGCLEKGSLFGTRDLLASRAFEDVPKLGNVGDGDRALVIKSLVSWALAGPSQTATWQYLPRMASVAPDQVPPKALVGGDCHGHGACLDCPRPYREDHRGWPPSPIRFQTCRALSGFVPSLAIRRASSLDASACRSTVSARDPC